MNQLFTVMPIIRKRRFKGLFHVLKEYASSDINEAYLSNICNDRHNRLLIHSMNENPNLNEITTLIIYRLTSNTKIKKRYALIVFLVHPLLRNNGFGNLAMKEFLDHLICRSKTDVEILLHSVPKSIPFYEKFGFQSTKPTQFLKSYEDIEKHTGCFSLTLKKNENDGL